MVEAVRPAQIIIVRHAEKPPPIGAMVPLFCNSHDPTLRTAPMAITVDTRFTLEEETALAETVLATGGAANVAGRSLRCDVDFRS